MAGGEAADGGAAEGGGVESAQSSPGGGEENGETIEMCRRGSDAEAAEVETRQPGSTAERLLLGVRRALHLREPPPPGRPNVLTRHTQLQQN